MKTKKLLLFLISGTLTTAFAHGQINVMNHRKLVQNKAEAGGYYLIGQYKVQGSPFFNKQYLNGSFYSATETAQNVDLRYELYYQTVEFVSSVNKDMALIKEPADLDSFKLYKNEKKGLKEDKTFISGVLIGGADKFFYEKLLKGSKYSLYKKYVSDLIIPLAKPGMSEMREFETNAEYWFVDETTMQFKEIKASVSAIRKEFANVKDISSVLKKGELFKKTDEGMIKAFAYLNE